MKQLEEQCMCVKFCFKLGKSLLNAEKQAYGEQCMSRMQRCGWFKCFKEGRTSVSEDPRPGRPSTSTDARHVERVLEAIRGDRRLTAREVAEDVGISMGSYHAILSRNLQMLRLSAKYSSRLLTDGQNEN